jgi:hypothetical protein
MPAPESIVLAEQLEITATVDGNQVLTISKALYKAAVNEPRAVTIQVSDKASLLKCRLGAVLKIEIGRGGGIHNLNFEGIIKVIKPGNQTHTIVAIDRITSLATSEYHNFKESNIVGQDLYFLIKDAADYRDIDVTDTLLGSTLIATKEMGLAGLQKRKDFIDKCMEFMITSFDDDFHDNTDFLRYNYAIRSGNKFDIYLADFKHKGIQPVLTISEDDANITGEGIVAQIDTTRLYNSITAQSKSDATIFETVSNEQSIKQYGPSSALITLDTTNRGILENTAYETLQSYSTPTVSYAITMHNAEWLGLGDLVQLDVPMLEKDVILPVVAYETEIGDTLVTKLTLGEPELNLKDFVRQLQL